MSRRVNGKSVDRWPQELPSSPLDLAPNETVCEKCFLIQPCECGQDG
jgi:hypothetical protein